LDRAGQVAALLLLACGVGMIACGMISDRLSRDRPEQKINLAIAYSLGTAVCLTVAFSLPVGTAQLVLIACAMFLVAGTVGPTGAMVANLTPLAIHGSAFATLTLANNLIGLAPGPILTGRLADAIGLASAFRFLPLPCIAAGVVFALMRRSYLADLERRQAVPA
jgi:MFS family permease